MIGSLEVIKSTNEKISGETGKIFLILFYLFILLLIPEVNACQLKDSLSFKVAGWFPDVSGLIRYKLVYPKGVSADEVEAVRDMVFLWLEKDFQDGKVGYYFDVRYWDENLGSYPDEFWLEEGYVYAETFLGKLKAGNIHIPFGIPWDHTYYGSILYYKGYLCDADYGFVLENNKVFNNRTELDSAFGYFFREDDLNGATILGEGPEHLSHGERNTFVGRLNPKFNLGDNSSLSLGISALTGELRSTGADRQLVFEPDVVYNLGPLTLTCEYVFYDRNFDNKDPTVRGDLFFCRSLL